MLRYISLLLFIGLSFSQDITIAVFDFENNGLEDYQVRQITRRIESQLIKHKGIDVVERNKIDDILKEQKLQMSGIVDEGKYLVELGKMLGANKVVMGSIGKIADDYFTITAKLTDVETGKMINSVDYDSENGIKDIFKEGLIIITNKLVTNTSNSLDANLIENTLFGEWFALEPLLLKNNNSLQHITFCKPNGLWDEDLYEGNWYKTDVGCFMSGQLVPRYGYASLNKQDIFSKYMHSFLSFFEYKIENELLFLKIKETFDGYQENEIVEISIISLNNNELILKSKDGEQLFYKYELTDYSQIDDNSWKKPLTKNELWHLKNEDFLGRNLQDITVTRSSTGVQRKLIIPGGKIEYKEKKNFRLNTEIRLINGKVISKWGEVIITPEHPLMKIKFGLQDAVWAMPYDGHWRIFLPAEYCYGDQGTEIIPPYSVLIIDIKHI